MMRFISVFLFLSLWYLPAYALVVETPLGDPEQEKQAQEIFRQIRCMSCAGESVAESNAFFSQELRAAIRADVQQGKSKKEILQNLRGRFGDSILMEPPFSEATLLLWALPLLLLIGGGLLIRKVTLGPRP